MDFSRVKTTWELDEVSSAWQFFFDLSNLAGNMSKFVHEVIIETTNCTGTGCSRRGREARWKHEGKTKGGKMRHMWFMSREEKKMIEIIFFLLGVF